MTNKEKTKDYIYMELWKNSVAEALSKQRAANSKFFFSYFVPGMWQGKYRGSVKVRRFCYIVFLVLCIIFIKVMSVSFFFECIIVCDLIEENLFKFITIQNFLFS